jgi:Ca-activated chloride channel family protein
LDLKRSFSNNSLLIFLTLCIISLVVIDSVRRDQLSVKDGDVIVLSMAYSSEKRGWIEHLTNRFVDHWHDNDLGDGKDIHVQFNAFGSRESLIQILSGGLKPVIWSPAASLWVPLFDWMWQEQYDSSIITSFSSIVFSPIVIGTWQSYADEHNITGFASLHQLALDGSLLFAHTDPQLSNSGYMGVILELCAAIDGSPEDITYDKETGIGTLTNSTVKQWVRELEKTAVHYGSSTGFLAKRAALGGPSEINAFIVYENLIIENNKQGLEEQWGDKLVAIYPEDGTLFSDHPFTILDADWVSEEQKEAAQIFLDFIKTTKIQELAPQYGLRPTVPISPSVIHEHFSEEMGVQEIIPVDQFNISLVDPEVINRIPDFWLSVKATSLVSNAGQNSLITYNGSFIASWLLTPIVLSVIILKRRKRL